MATNRYDKDDIVRRETLLLASGLKFAAYRVQDGMNEAGDAEFSSLQFHFTWDNTVIAMMPQSVAEAFIPFAREVAENSKEPFWGMAGRTSSTGFNFIAQRRPAADDGTPGTVVIIVKYHDMILAVMPPETATLFATLVEKAVTPPQETPDADQG